MNLLLDPWIPVRCRSGLRCLVSPLDLFDADDPALALDAIRPDFNGALAQFLIGLWQWLAPDDEDEWRQIALGQGLPDFEQLRELAHCFEFDDGARRFMQDADFDSMTTGDMSALLLESPGDNTIKNNADLFVKRSEATALTLPLAAQALLTLQINAPSGGQGYRTSIRGGGPLSMLLWPDEIVGQPVPLWRKLWLNTLVLEGDKPREEIIFPWMTDCLTSEKQGPEKRERDVRTTLAQKNPTEIELAILSYFATPRRIRLQFEDGCQCSLSGQMGRCATGFEARNLGANYRSELFRHPLSPYYLSEIKQKNKKSEKGFLPVHIGPLGFTYVDWLASQEDSPDFRKPRVLDLGRLGQELRQKLPANAIWAFGFSMDNMKCLAWHEAHLPILAIEDRVHLSEVLLEARRWINATEQVRKELSEQLKKAWGAPKGDTHVAERSLYALTDSGFHVLLQEYAASLPADDADRDMQRQRLRKHWQQQLAKAAMHLFEHHAEQSDAAETNVQALERIAFAHRALSFTVHVMVRKTLELGTAQRTTKKSSRTRRLAT